MITPASLRGKTYFCLFPRLNQCIDQGSLVCFYTVLFAFPFYTLLVFSILTISMATTTCWLTVSLIEMRYKSNSYLSTCGSIRDCNYSQGLYCSSANNLCNCPERYTKGKCDCQIGYYWNGTACALKIPELACMTSIVMKKSN